ncbi:MAG TPA: protein kinase [Kofleriaceae bacterium]|nr:protein kinase [Kofleriaceae bacterium]
MDADLGGGESPVLPHKDAGTTFGKYTLLCKLATGGMGELFVARQTGAGGFEKLVVIKRLLPHLAEDAHFVAMLLDEARIAARLSHPNVCQVYDLGEAEGHYYIAMEHLEGVPASMLLRRARRVGQRLEVGLAAAILRQTCDGLHHAHDLTDSEGNSIGLVHRDVSPSNLFVTSTGVVKVLDFGVAKSQDALARTHTGALKGKYAYMSPEQVLGNPVDRRADVFSLGVVLFELLTAQRLFWRDSEYKMFQAIVEDPIPSLLELRPGLPPPVAHIALRALSRDPDRRFPSARDMGEALEEAIGGSGGVWKTAQVADYLMQHFGALVEERRRDVQTGVSQANRLRRPRTTTGGVSAPTAERTPSRSAQPSREPPAESEAAVPEPAARRETGPYPEATPPSRARGWLGALAIAAALGGGGVFAYNQLGGRSKAEPTKVVVLGGEIETEDGRIARAKQRSTAESDPVAPPAAASDAGPAEKSTPPAGSQKGTAGKTKAERDPYRAQLARHQEQIRTCFNQNATTVSGAPELSLSLSIDTDGSVRAASLVPADLESTALGECLLGVARGVTFGAQDDEVQVTIPLKVKRRSK